MKHQYKLTLLAASLVTAFAANVAVAGNIQSSSVGIAREVVTSDEQVVTSPLITYRFQGDVDATSQTQTFQVQLKLTSGGTWSEAVAGSVTLKDGSGMTPDGVKVPYDLLAKNIGISDDKKTLWATFIVEQGTKRYVTPVIQFNPNTTAVVGTGAPGTAASATVPTYASKLATLKTVVGTVAACDTAVKTLPVTVLHYTALSSPDKMADGTSNGFADEHARNASNNNGTLLTFPTNLYVTVKPSTGTAKIDPSSPSLNTRFMKTGAGTTFISASRLLLGTVTLSQNANGYDSDLTNYYLLADAHLPKGVGAGAAKMSTTSAFVDGRVEAKDLVVTITSNQGFAGSVYLSADAATCAPFGTAPVQSQSADGKVMTVKLGATNVNAAFGPTGTNPVAVCYDVTNVTSAIPPSTFSAVALLSKATGTLPTPEQDNSCNGPLYPLSGGVKIDVRNYATSKQQGPWMSVIRLINPSETNTATVYGQLLHADGSYGGWGQIATLAPRAVRNMTAAEIDALTVNAPVSNGAGYVGGAVAPISKPTGARLRVTADGVSSLRVQNYLYNSLTQIAIEASSTQGVDWEGNDDRAPMFENQYMDQDAQRGLAK